MSSQSFSHGLTEHAIEHCIKIDCKVGKKYYLCDKRGRDRRRTEILAYAKRYREINRNAIRAQKRASNKTIAYRKSHKEEIASYGRIWRAKNREKLVIRSKEWHRKNAARKRELSMAWRKANSQRYKKAGEAWRKANPEHWLALCKNNAARRRTPIRKQALAKIYAKECTAFYLACPNGFHVDHIVPVKGKNVNGLHVPWNLQYLSAHDNMVKGNRL